MKYLRSKINRISFFFHTILPTLLTISIFIFLIFVFIIPYFEENMINGKKEMLRELVSSTLSIASRYNQEAVEGKISFAEAQDAAKKRIEYLRYGIDNKDYFWITDNSPNMIMHPYRNDLNGKDLSDFKDANGKKIFVEFVDLVKKQEEGYVDYMWQWMDDSDRIVPKISFVKEFKPWGWVVGTGIYIEDVRKEMSTMKKNLTMVSTAISIIMAFLLTLIVRQNLQTERKRSIAKEELKVSREKYKALVEASADGALMILEGKCIYANKITTELLRYPDNSPEYDNFSGFIHPDRDEDIRKFNEFTNSPKDSFIIETELVTKDGDSVIVMLSGSGITLNNKEGYVLLIKDLLSGKDSTTKTLQDGYDNGFLPLCDSLSIGAFIMVPGKKGKLIECNSKANSIFELGNKENPGNINLWDMIDDFDIKRTFLDLMETNENISGFEIPIRLKDGALKTIKFYISKPNLKSGENKFINGVAFDQTDEIKNDLNKKNQINKLKMSLSFLEQPVDKISENIISCKPDTTVKEAAVLMRIYGRDALLISDEPGSFIGIVTNKDIRTGVIESGLSTNSPVKSIMSYPLITTTKQTKISEATAMMLLHNVNQLILTDESNSLYGLVTSNALNRFQINSPEILYNYITNARTVTDLKNVLSKIPYYIDNIINAETPISAIPEYITRIADLATIKVSEFAILELGKPPGTFAFVALGSQGRQEQSPISDQDNAIIYRETENKSAEKYFLEFGQRINMLLDDIGYPLCKGEIMAQNPKWNQPLETWKKYFTGWIVTPEPKNLLDLSAFFDIRTVFGSNELTGELYDHIFTVLKNNPAFFNYLARECAAYKLPLSISGKIHSDSGEEHKESINIKNIIRIIVNITRLYSMQADVRETGTLIRLKKLYELNKISNQNYKDLSFGYEFLTSLQLKRQSANKNKIPARDYYIPIDKISPEEETNLKSIFSHLALIQTKIKNDFSIQ